jgi:hypothetical protein
VTYALVGVLSVVAMIILRRSAATVALAGSPAP